MGRNDHNLRNAVSTVIVLFAAFALTQTVQAATEEDLEPCINGGVSATGLYVSQAEEDRTMLSELVDSDQIFDELELEPCVNGGVSATGMYHSQEVEEDMTEQFVQADEPDC